MRAPLQISLRTAVRQLDFYTADKTPLSLTNDTEGSEHAKER